MTEREFQLWVEGQHKRDDWILDVLAWMQVNLINIHVPRGKGRVTKQRIRPTKPSREGIFAWAKRVLSGLGIGEREPLPPLPPVKPGDKEAARKALRERRKHMVAREEREAEREFWSTPEGRKLREQMDDGDDFWETEEGRDLLEKLGEDEE